VVVFAFIIAFSAASLGRAFNTLKAVEVWARNITGVLFILTGIWFILRYVFHLF
jgi:threonine/homoserine/homoserine lactone efflux protein